jgi:hypothetical protein
VPEVEASFQLHRDEKSTRVTAKKKFKVQTQGITDEELEAEQAAMFAAAAAAVSSNPNM